MDITPIEPDPIAPGGRQVIQGYGDGRFRINGEVHQGSVIVFPEVSIAWPVTSVADITPETLAAVLDHQPPVELLLIGCGPRMAPIPFALHQALRGHGLPVDPMDTGAACRTYTLLTLEGRRVAAALIAV